MPIEPGVNAGYDAVEGGGVATGAAADVVGYAVGGMGDDVEEVMDQVRIVVPIFKFTNGRGCANVMGN